jgi:hypothetical protein
MNRTVEGLFCILLLTLAGTTTQRDLAEFPTFGISFQPPLQNTAKEPYPADLVSHYLFDAKSPYAGAGIEIWCTPAEGHSADDWAQAQKESGSGTVEKADIAMGGEKAVKVESDLNDGRFTHSIAYLAVHGKLAYKIVALNKPGVDADEAAQAIMATVVFSPPQKPVKYVDEMFPSSWFVFDKLAVRVPTCTRMEIQNAAEFELVVVDYTGPIAFAPLAIDLKHIHAAKKVDFSDLQANYSAVLEKQLLPDGQHLKWHAADRLPGLNICDSVLAKATATTHGCRNHVQVCMLELSPGDFVQLVSTIPDLPADEVKTYQLLSDRILKSIELVKNETKISK